MHRPTKRFAIFSGTLLVMWLMIGAAVYVIVISLRRSSSHYFHACDHHNCELTVVILDP